MTQTLILLCTLAAMAGFPLGYFLGWLDSMAQPVLGAIVGVYTGTCEIDKQCTAVLHAWIASMETGHV